MLIDTVESYLNVRRAAGFKAKDADYYLKSYACFATERGETHVCSTTAIAWASTASTPEARGRRIEAVIRFARYARAENTEHEIPPNGVFVSTRPRRKPHIFSPDELRQLLVEAQHLGPPGSLRPHRYHTLFGLLASCGLRISEALALRIDDVTPDGLVIRNTKFRKSRLVPLHKTTAAALANYLNYRLGVGGNEDRLFISRRGGPLHYTLANKTFLFIVRKLGIHPGPGCKPGPRIHDLRHTWAVRALESCPDGRDRITKHMMAISTYLGHTHVTDTYWYLHNTPRLMTDISDACESFLEGVQP